MLRTVVSGILDLLAPPRCPGCQLPQSTQQSEGSFCAACALLVELAPPGMRPPAQHGVAVLYQGPMADAIRHFKYARQSSIARLLSPWLVAAARAATSVDAVVPMPLHPAKLRARGWNQSALLARPVARVLGVPMRPSWLRRVRDTATQAGLSRTARHSNVAGAFRAAPVPGMRVLLIDDVKTTGATLLEATRCLEARGHTVASLALAWAHDADHAPLDTCDPQPGHDGTEPTSRSAGEREGAG
ncbi:MAG: hypothetical protein RL701_6666 [Pseudomonadota bacterium]